MITKRQLVKLFQIYGWPFYILIIITGLGIAGLAFYFGVTQDKTETIKLGIGAVLTLLATFAGIFVPLLIQRRQKTADDKRQMVFCLSMIWGELRANLHILEEVKSNFKFKMLSEYPDFPRMVEFVYTKFITLYSLTGETKNEAFMASQQSGSITTLDEDAVLNSIFQAYENLNLLKTMALTTKESLSLKMNVAHQTDSSLPQGFEEKFRGEIKADLLKVASEIDFSMIKTLEAISILDKKLAGSGIKAELEDRDLPQLTQVP